jgi:hypothetical protein
MKRRLGALMLAAAVGGCMSSNTNTPMHTEPTVRASGPYPGNSVPGVTGPWGEPVQAVAPYTTSPWMSARQASYLMSQSVPLNMTNMDPSVVQVGAQMPAGPQGGMPQMPMPPGGMIAPPGFPSTPGLPPGVGIMPPGGGMPMDGSNAMGWRPGPPSGAQGASVMPPNAMMYSPNGPFPGGIPPGAVAAIGGMTGNGGPAPGPGYTVGRTQVRFGGPSGMKVAWLTQGPDGKPIYSAPMVEAPGRYNFLQASIYRLKLSAVDKRPGLEVYPTLEVVPCNRKTEAFLAHSAVPVAFTDDDFREVAEGKYLVKVIYLPDPQFAELAAAGTDEIISTRLEPGADPILEAQRRGSILLVIRLGNVDQEAPNTPPLDNHGPQGGMAGMMPPGMMPPGMMPPGMMPPGMMPPGMMPPGMMPPSMAGLVPMPPGMMPPMPPMPPGMAGPAPGAGGPIAGPSVPAYLRPGSSMPLPGLPAAPPATAPGNAFPAPMPNGLPVSPPAAGPGPTSQLPDMSGIHQTGFLPPSLPTNSTWPASAPQTPAGLAGQSGGGSQ